MEDPGLQQAIYASIQTARPGAIPQRASAPDPPSLNVAAGLPSTRAGSKARPIGTSGKCFADILAARHYAQAAGYGRVHALLREGLVPVRITGEVKKKSSSPPRASGRESHLRAGGIGIPGVGEQVHLVSSDAPAASGAPMRRRSEGHIIVMPGMGQTLKNAAGAAVAADAAAEQAQAQHRRFLSQSSAAGSGSGKLATAGDVDAVLQEFAAQQQRHGDNASSGHSAVVYRAIGAATAEAQSRYEAAISAGVPVRSAITSAQPRAPTPPVAAWPAPGGAAVAPSGSGSSLQSARSAPLPPSLPPAPIALSAPLSARCDSIPRSLVPAAAWQAAPTATRNDVTPRAAAAVAATPRAVGGPVRAANGPPPRQMVAVKGSNGVKVVPEGLDPDLVAQIMQDAVTWDTGVTFADIAGHDRAKELLHEAVALPLIIPEFFTGIREPWRGVLLFGPPGTGKTLLAKAVANMVGGAFFAVSPASLTSKMRGESERLLKTLFVLAQVHAPSIIYIDEIDGLGTTRGETGENEASRRFKSELLQQMDGLASGQNIMVLAATNCPWDLDPALRRRFEKRVLIDLPNFEARLQLLRLHLRGVTLGTGVNLVELASSTEGYSGADIKLLCREAAMAPLRRQLAASRLTSAAEIRRMSDNGELLARCIVDAEDLQTARKTVQPSVHQSTLAKYEQWAKEFSA